MTQQDRDTVASIRGAVARISNITSNVNKWSSVDSKDLAKVHWIHSGELSLGSDFPHAIAKKYPKLMPTRQDQSLKRYVILTHEALFLAWYAPRRRARGSSSASKNADDEIIAELIKHYDKDGSGGLDIDEVSKFLHEAGGGKAPTQEELLWVMQTASPQTKKHGNKNEHRPQELKIEHLRAASLAYSEYRQREAELDEIFDKYDKDDDEDLDRAELTNFITDYLAAADARKGIEGNLSEEQQRELDNTRTQRVDTMVQNVLEQGGCIKEDAVTKPEMIKALVFIQNEGESVDPKVEEEKSSIVIKMHVKLDANRKMAQEMRSAKSFKEAVEKAAYEIHDLTAAFDSEVSSATAQGGGHQHATPPAAAENGEEAGAEEGAIGGKKVVRDIKVSVHIPYTESLEDDNEVEEMFKDSKSQFYFTVVVEGDIKSITNFKLSKRKLSKRLNEAGWLVKGIDEIFSYFPDTFEVSDVIPLTEVVTPLVVNRMTRTSRNTGLLDVAKRLWKSVWKARRDHSKKPVALTVLLSLPMKAHNLTKELKNELAVATCHALNAAFQSVKISNALVGPNSLGPGLDRAALPALRSTIVRAHNLLDTSHVHIRDVKAIAGTTQHEVEHEVDEGLPGAELDQFEYKWDLFISYRVTSDADLVEKLYDKITKEHPTMKVFLDKRELVLGEAWGQGFADAITHSRVVALVMSRGTFSCPHGKTCDNCPHNIARLQRNPDAEDNVILEYDLALDMFDMGRIKRIVPLLVGDLHDHEHLGAMYHDFFDKFKPCLSWDAVPDRKASTIQKRACHMLSKFPELKLQLDATKDKNLKHKKLREGIPSLLRGRTVRQTLTAITSMQGIKLVGLPDSTISEACKRLGETAWDLRILDENKEVEYHHGPKMDHTSVEILVDAFHKAHIHQQVTCLSFLLLGLHRPSPLSLPRFPPPVC